MILYKLCCIFEVIMSAFQSAFSAHFWVLSKEKKILNTIQMISIRDDKLILYIFKRSIYCMEKKMENNRTLNCQHLFRAFIFYMHSNLILQSLAFFRFLYLHYICHFSFGVFWCRSTMYWIFWNLSRSIYTNVYTRTCTYMIFIYLFMRYRIHITHIFICLCFFVVL